MSFALNLAKSPEYLKTRMKLSLVKTLFGDFLMGPTNSTAFLMNSYSVILDESISSKTKNPASAFFID
jgi:hypothetical protein